MRPASASGTASRGFTSHGKKTCGKNLLQETWHKNACQAASEQVLCSDCLELDITITDTVRQHHALPAQDFEGKESTQDRLPRQDAHRKWPKDHQQQAPSGPARPGRIAASLGDRLRLNTTGQACSHGARPPFLLRQQRCRLGAAGCTTEGSFHSRGNDWQTLETPCCSGSDMQTINMEHWIGSRFRVPHLVLRAAVRPRRPSELPQREISAGFPSVSG